MRFWPQSLAGQLIAVLLPALILSQVLGYVISADERVRAIRLENRNEFLIRTGSVARLLQNTPTEDHDEIIAGMASAGIRFWITVEPPSDAKRWRQEAWQRLNQSLPITPEGDKPLGTYDGNIEASNTLTDEWGPPPQGNWSLPAQARFIVLDPRYGSGVVTQLVDGRWLNGVFAKPYYGQIWQSQSLISISLTAILLSGLAFLISRRIARPMHKLTEAAEAFGRGEEIQRLAEEGPADIRRMAGTFNVMQDRLKLFISDRTAMLAAIGHDLLTPITSLRLRAEFMPDAEERQKFLTTLDDMLAITEASLTFAREQAVGETTRMVDVAILAETICDDLVDLGNDVSFTESSRITYRCRPTAIRRAVRNLVENAIRYGERARVSVSQSAASIDVIVEDDGPGIPHDEIERVFKPFVRLERSRSRETGGSGLGLSIARTIARAHGGDVILINYGKGLRAVLRLPQLAGASDLNIDEHRSAAE